MAYMESYEQLAFAIVKLAVEDYRSALKRLKRHSKDQQALWSKSRAKDNIIMAMLQ